MRAPEVRVATVDDVDAVWPLVSEFATSFVPTLAGFRRSLAAVLEQPDMMVAVAELDGEVVGYVLANKHLTFFADKPVVWVEEVMVANAHRRRHIGQALMAAVEEWANTKGAAYVSLATRRAGNFYSAIGYEESAVFFRRLTEGAAWRGSTASA